MLLEFICNSTPDNPTPGIEYVISDFNHLAGKDLFFQLHFVKEQKGKAYQWPWKQPRVGLRGNSLGGKKKKTASPCLPEESTQKQSAIHLLANSWLP
jgi:hypothetical protein